MAVRFAEGFDWCSDAIQLAGRGAVTGSPTLATDSVRALRLPGVFATFANGFTCELESDISTNRICLHFRIRATGEIGANVAQIFVRNTAGSVVFRAYFSTSNALLVQDGGGGTVLTYNAAITENVWAHFGIDVVVNSTTGSVDVYRDGVNVASASNVNTQSASGDIRDVQFGNTANAHLDFDDIVIDDAGYLGEVDVDYHPVDSDIGTSDWDPSTMGPVYEVLDEAPNNGDTDYATSDTDTDLTRHGVTPGYSGRAIYAVQPIIVARVEEASSSQVLTTLHSGASDDGGVAHPLTTGYRGYGGVLSVQDPDTSSAWDPDDLDSIEVSVEHHAP